MPVLCAYIYVLTVCVHRSDCMSALVYVHTCVLFFMCVLSCVHVYVAAVCPRTGLKLLNYQHWFKKVVPVWLRVAIARCKERIDKAVEVDQVCQLESAFIVGQLQCISGRISYFQINRNCGV